MPISPPLGLRILPRTVDDVNSAGMIPSGPRCTPTDLPYRTDRGPTCRSSRSPHSRIHGETAEAAGVLARRDFQRVFSQ